MVGADHTKAAPNTKVGGQKGLMRLEPCPPLDCLGWLQPLPTVANRWCQPPNPPPQQRSNQVNCFQGALFLYAREVFHRLAPFDGAFLEGFRLTCVSPGASDSQPEPRPCASPPTRPRSRPLFRSRSIARPSSDFRQHDAQRTLPVLDLPRALAGSIWANRIGRPHSRHGGRSAWVAPCSLNRTR